LFLPKEPEVSEYRHQAIGSFVVLNLTMLVTFLAEEQKVGVLFTFVGAKNIVVCIHFVKNTCFFEMDKISVNGNPIDNVNFLGEDLNQICLTQRGLGFNKGQQYVSSKRCLFEAMSSQYTVNVCDLFLSS
jgi:hypothetical protein